MGSRIEFPQWALMAGCHISIQEIYCWPLTGVDLVGSCPRTWKLPHKKKMTEHLLVSYVVPNQCGSSNLNCGVAQNGQDTICYKRIWLPSAPRRPCVVSNRLETTCLASEGGSSKRLSWLCGIHEKSYCWGEGQKVSPFPQSKLSQDLS